MDYFSDRDWRTCYDAAARVHPDQAGVRLLPLLRRTSGDFGRVWQGKLIQTNPGLD